MAGMPTVELLESQYDFPCRFTMKAIGKVEDDFVLRVVFAVRDELNMTADPAFRTNETKGGRHVSVTVEPVFETPQQVLALYSRLSQLDGLVMQL